MLFDLLEDVHTVLSDCVVQPVPILISNPDVA